MQFRSQAILIYIIGPLPPICYGVQQVQEGSPKHHDTKRQGMPVVLILQSLQKCLFTFVASYVEKEVN